MASKAGKSANNAIHGRDENAMSRKNIAGWSISLAIAWASCLMTISCKRAPELTPQQKEGKHLYSVRCAHCHEENDLALKKVPPDLHGIFTRTTLPSGAKATDVSVRTVVTSGKGVMPSFAGRFNNEQMNDLLAYLHTGLR
jgi:mono/diheme cytochrome c family protein